MIPNSILEVALLAAALGPGYVYVRIARAKRPRGSQSQVAELVEMLVIGALASLLSAGLVLTIAKALGFIDTQALAEDFNSYVLSEPARSFTVLTAFYAVSYLEAWGVALLRFHGESDYEPDGSAWYQAFAIGCPPDSLPFLTIELKDGRWIAGAYKKATVERHENREICLQRPWGIAERAGSPMTPQVDDDFVLLREEQIRLIKGRYLNQFETKEGVSAPVVRRQRPIGDRISAT